MFEPRCEMERAIYAAAFAAAVTTSVNLLESVPVEPTRIYSCGSSTYPPSAPVVYSGGLVDEEWEKAAQARAARAAEYAVKLYRGGE